MRTRTPIYGRGERIADRCVHYVGLVAAVLGSVVLIVAAAERERALTIVSVCIYGAGLLGMIGASALYNLAEPSRRKEWLRRLDHAAIFLMIAGTTRPSRSCAWAVNGASASPSSSGSPPSRASR